jgi:hypothetical protein
MEKTSPGQTQKQVPDGGKTRIVFFGRTKRFNQLVEAVDESLGMTFLWT